MHLAYVSRVYGSTDPGRYPGSTVRQTAHESQLLTPHAEGMTSTLALADAAPAAQPEPTIFYPPASLLLGRVPHVRAFTPTWRGGVVAVAFCALRSLGPTSAYSSRANHRAAQALPTMTLSHCSRLAHLQKEGSDASEAKRRPAITRHDQRRVAKQLVGDRAAPMSWSPSHSPFGLSLAGER